jgi:phosphatidylglycerophosphate synthase
MVSSFNSPTAAPDPALTRRDDGEPAGSGRNCAYHRCLNRLPFALTLTRAALAPVVAVLALFTPYGTAFGFCLAVAFLSDALDGILARRLGVATPNLRRLDSAADTLFYVAATFAVWHLRPSAITERGGPLLVLLTLEIGRYALDYVKFGREASYHMWSSKVWGIALFAGFTSLLAFGSNGVLVEFMIYLGIAADLEGIAISMTLPTWRADVPTIVHAVRLRRHERT